MNAFVAHVETLELAPPLARDSVPESWRDTHRTPSFRTARAAPEAWQPSVAPEAEAMEEDPERWDGMS